MRNQQRPHHHRPHRSQLPGNSRQGRIPRRHEDGFIDAGERVSLLSLWKLQLEGILNARSIESIIRMIFHNINYNHLLSRLN